MTKVEDTISATKFGKKRKFDPRFHGPIKNRNCTDIFCLFVFFAFSAGWVYIAYYAFSEGLLERIIHPTDSQGQICGYDVALKRPFLFYFDLTKCMGPEVLIAGCTLTNSVCVSHCPNTSFVYAQLLAGNLLSSSVDASQLICLEDIDKTEFRTFSDVQIAVINGSCAAYYFPSGPVGGRCLPGFSEGLDGRAVTVFDHINTSVTVTDQKISFVDVFNGSTWLNIFIQTEQTFQRIAVDYRKSWITIVIGLVAATVLSLLWIIMIRWIAGPLLWLSLYAIVGGLGYGVFYCYEKYTTFSTYLGTNATLVTSNEEFNWKDISNYVTNPTFWFVIGIICLAVLVIMILIVMFMRKRIRTAIALIRVSSRAISHMTSTLLFPLVPLGLQLITLGACGSCSVWLTATGTAQGIVHGSLDDVAGLRENDSCDPNKFAFNFPNASGSCKFVQFHRDSFLIFFQFYNAFGFFWGLAFSTALGQMALAGAFASYYWAWLKPKHVPALPLLASLYRCLRYHLGSLAFGSMLVAIVQIFQAILLYIQRKLKMSDNIVTRFLIRICICCLFCLEKCIKFINRNAYIMIAIFGKNFCASARDAFMLLTRNILRVMIVDSVVAFFLFFGKILILGSLGCFFYYFYSCEIPGLEKFAPKLNYVYVPIVTTIVGSFVISSMFFNVYVMAIDTMFLCFLEDIERNDGSPEKPYYMSKSLMKIYGKRNKSVELQEEISNISIAVRKRKI